MLSWLGYLYTLLALTGLTLVTPVLSLTILTWLHISNATPQLPWVGLKKQIFPKLRASLRELSAKRGPINEGYEKYSKHGQAFIIPSMLSPEVVLPPSNALWIAHQPESVLSNVKILEDVLALNFTSHGPDVLSRQDFSVIRRDLTRQMSSLLPDVRNELSASFKEEVGNDLAEWKDLRIYKAITRMSRRTSNRVFVGLPLCRDKKYLARLRIWEVAFAVSSAVIRYIIPERLKPVFAPLVAAPVYFVAWTLQKRLIPLIRQRLILRKETSVSKADTDISDRPNDVLQWIIDSNGSTKSTPRMSIEDIAGKTILLNFFAVHTTALTLSAVLFDILCYPSASSLMEELRSEAEAVMPKLEQDPRAVRAMTKLDSVIRETLRQSSMSGRGLLREVVQPGGVVTPDGLYLPEGTHVCTVVAPVQSDRDLCDRGAEYIPLRYYKPLTETSSLEDKQRSTVHVSEDFLSFGLGKHACPGRFFAVMTVKVMLGHLLTEYDFEPLEERPKVLEVGEAIVPSDKAVVKIRRRRERGHPEGGGPRNADEVA